MRCLCLAGCRIDVKNDQGVSAEIAALAQGHKDTSDLLKRLKRDSCCDDYIEQLIPSTSPIPKIKMKVFGHSGVGKTTLIESLRAGYFSGLFRRSKRSGSSSSSSATSSSKINNSSSSNNAAVGGSSRGSKSGKCRFLQDYVKKVNTYLIDNTKINP